MITITRGKDKDFFINLFSSSTKRPFDLSQLVTAKIKFLKDDGSTLDKTYPGGGITIVSAGGGRIKISLEVADTPSLKKIAASTMELEYELGLAAAGDAANYKDILYIPAAYQVVKSQYE